MIKIACVLSYVYCTQVLDMNSNGLKPGNLRATCIGRGREADVDLVERKKSAGSQKHSSAISNLDK